MAKSLTAQASEKLILEEIKLRKEGGAKWANTKL